MYFSCFLLHTNLLNIVVSLNDHSHQLRASRLTRFLIRSLYLILIPLFLSSLNETSFKALKTSEGRKFSFWCVNQNVIYFNINKYIHGRRNRVFFRKKIMIWCSNIQLWYKKSLNTFYPCFVRFWSVKYSEEN